MYHFLNFAERIKRLSVTLKRVKISVSLRTTYISLMNISMSPKNTIILKQTRESTYALSADYSVEYSR
jgi:hypothetical protein